MYVILYIYLFMYTVDQPGVCTSASGVKCWRWLRRRSARTTSLDSKALKTLYASTWYLRVRNVQYTAQRVYYMKRRRGGGRTRAYWNNSNGRTVVYIRIGRARPSFYPLCARRPISWRCRLPVRFSIAGTRAPQSLDASPSPSFPLRHYMRTTFSSGTRPSNLTSGVFFSPIKPHSAVQQRT